MRQKRISILLALIMLCSSFIFVPTTSITQADPLPPVIYLISPKNQSTINLEPTCQIWANDTDSVNLTVNFYNSTDGVTYYPQQKNTTIGSSTTDFGQLTDDGNYMRANYYTGGTKQSRVWGLTDCIAPMTGYVYSITAKVRCVGVDTNTRCAIYFDNGSFIAQTEEILLDANGQKLSIIYNFPSPVHVTNGTTYVLAFTADHSVLTANITNTVVLYFNTFGSDSRWNSYINGYPTWPNPWTSYSNYQAAMTLYATMGIGISNATLMKWNFSEANAYSTTYHWKVTADDGTFNVSKIYQFTTKAYVAPPPLQNFTLLWTSPFLYMDVCCQNPLIIDVNKDGYKDIIVAGANKRGRIACINGSNGALMWMRNITYGSIAATRWLEAGDLKGDGDCEIIVSGYSATTCYYARNGTIMWHNSESGNEEHELILSVNGTTYVYICHPSNNDSNATGHCGHIAKCYGRNGTVITRRDVYYPCHGGLSAGDINGDGKVEIIMTGRGSSAYPEGGGIQCFDTNLNGIWQRRDIMCSSLCAVLEDYNGDGKLDVILTDLYYTPPWPSIYILNGTNGQTMKKWSHVPGLRTHEQLAVYDIDNDGHLELASCVYSPVKVVDLTTGVVKATLGSPPHNGSNGKGPFYANVVGNDSLEMICGQEESNISIYSNQWKLVDRIFTSTENSVVQDINNDGYNELIIQSDNASGRRGHVKAYETLARAPSPLPNTMNNDYGNTRTRTALNQTLTGTTIFVATTGNDVTGDGSIGTPYKTLRKAINVSSDSGTIYMRGGDYTNLGGGSSGYIRIDRSGTKAAPFTIQNYNNEKVVIDGKLISLPSSYAMFLLYGSSLTTFYNNITIRGLNFSNCSRDAIRCYGDATSGNSDIHIINCSFYNIFWWSIVFYTEHSDGHYLENLSVTGCRFDHTEMGYTFHESVSFYGSKNWVFANNSVGYHKGIFVDAGEGGLNGLIENNVFHVNTTTSIKIDPATYGTQTISNIIIRNNLFWGTIANGQNYSGSIYLMPEVSGGNLNNVSIYNNIMNVSVTNKDNYAHGIQIKASASRAINDITIEYNTIYTRNGTQSYNIFLYNTGGTFKNIVIANNILMNAGNAKWLIYGEGFANTSTAFNRYNNIYHRTDGATWTGHFSDGANKSESSAKKVDPRCVSTSTGDFHLNSTSPAIDTATPLYTISKDYDDNPRPYGSGYDIGAFECQSLSTVPTIYLVTPKNHTTGVNHQPKCRIVANESGGNSLDINWYSSMNGVGFTHRQKNATATANRTYQWNYTQANVNGTYYWRVTVSNGAYNISEMFYFTTKAIIRDNLGNTWPATGANLATAFNSLTANMELWMPPVRFDVTSNLYIGHDGIKIHGSGNLTRLNFTNAYLISDTNPSSGSESVRFKYGLNNILLENFSFAGLGQIEMTIGNNTILRNLRAEYIYQNVRPAAIRLVLANYSNTFSLCSASNLKVINCSVYKVAWHGIIINTALKGGTYEIDNVLFDRCRIEWAGWQFPGRPFPRTDGDGNWSAGLDVCEKYVGTLTIKDVLVRNCTAEYSWESGFHQEGAPTKINVTYLNCKSNFNGQKRNWMTNPGTYYCSGFLASTTGVAIKHCEANNNSLYGFYCSGNPSLLACSGIGNVRGTFHGNYINLSGIYVATNGNDITGNGSISNPYKTLQKAINMSTTGGTIIMRGGNYNTNIRPNYGILIKKSGVKTQPFTIKSYPGERAVINGNGYPITSGYALLMIGSASAFYNNITLSHLTIENSTSNLLYASALTWRSENIRVDNCTLNNCSLSALYFYTSNVTSEKRVNNITIEHCIINNSQTKRPLSMGEGAAFVGVRDFSFHHNVFTNCPKIMLDPGCNARHGVIYNNTFIQTYSTGTGIKLDGSQAGHGTPQYDAYISIYNNYFGGSCRAITIGAEQDGGDNNISIYNNVFNVTNNTENVDVVRFAETVSFWNTLDNITFMYNTVYCGNYGSPIQIVGWHERCKNIIIANNILQSSGAGDWQIFSPTSPGGINFTDPCMHLYNNVYNHTSKAPNTMWNGVGNQFETSAVKASPQFVSWKHGNFHLNSSSPAVDAALSLYVVSTDFDGTLRPKGRGYDIGAYESLGNGARIFYVATTGNDITGNGSIGNPWKTIQKGVNMSFAGDTLYIRRGTYHERVTMKRSGTVEQPIIVQGYSGERAIINGNGIALGSGDGLFEFWNGLVCYSNITLKNINIWNSTWMGATAYGKISGGVNSYTQHLVIDNCSFINITYGAIRFWGAPYQISNVTVSNCTFDRIETGFGDSEGITFRDCKDFACYNNRIGTCNGIAIVVCNNSANGRIYGNKIRCTESHVSAGYVGIYIDGAQVDLPRTSVVRNVSIYNNMLWGNTTTGFLNGIGLVSEFSGGSLNNISIYNNVINFSAIATTDSSALWLAYPQPVSDITISYNTLYVRDGTGRCINCQWRPGLGKIHNIVMADNILVSGGNTTYQMYFNYINSTDTRVIRYKNLYNHTSKAPNVIFNDISGPSAFEATAIKQSPQFISLRNNNFHLNATSPAINVGTVAYAPAYDFEGNYRPYGAGYDIGAYEWSGMLNVIISAFQSNFNKRFCVDLLNLSATVTNAMWVFLVIQTPRGAYINESLLENYSLATNGYWCNRTFSNGEPSGSLHYGYPDVRYGNGTYHAYIFAKNANGSAYSSTVDFKIYPNADVNMNGYVQPSDINYITSHDWGGNGASHFCVSDTNGNGHVQPSDIGFVTSLVHGWGWNGSP